MYNLDERGRLKVAAAVPTDPLEAVIRMKALEKYADLIVIDSSQGDHDYTFETLIAMKEAGATKDIMAGNVDNPKAALLLAEAGADGIKVGKGGGSICSTRPNLGIGTPQVTAVYECAKAVDRLDVPVCSDGGITNNGDIAIALAVGAKTVMMGNMFAGTDEAPGEVRTLSDQTKWKVYRGEGSLEALQENASSRQRYNQSAKGEVIAPQGVSGLVPYKGSASEICKLSIAYLRQTMSHTNCQNLEEFNRKTKLWRVTNAGLHESRVHDVAVN
jgi:IMP dehydrogenase